MTKELMRAAKQKVLEEKQKEALNLEAAQAKKAKE